MLNKHLNNLMPALTAKVFRTYNASFTFQEELKATPEDGTVHEKILAYNRANRQVAVLCNHQRSVSKGHGAQMERIHERVSLREPTAGSVRSLTGIADLVSKVPERSSEAQID
jgi:DNA topoisomerase-1